MTSCFLFLFILILSISVSSQCPGRDWYQSALDPEKCYRIITEYKSWFEAELFCGRIAMNSHLTSINSAFEAVFLQAIANGAQQQSTQNLTEMWIGANDFPGFFVWIDDMPFKFTNWAPGEPEEDPSKQCVTYAHATLQWKTVSCESKKGFICESYNGSSINSTPTSFGTSPVSSAPALTTTTASLTKATDCFDLRNLNGITTNGVYTIYPPGMEPFPVYCDMTTDGGGWTVFQKRQDNSEIFWSRLWRDYKKGFGSKLDQNSWLGLDRINALSSKDPHVTLRIDIRGNRCNGSACGGSFNPNGNWYGVWESFRIGNETTGYQLQLAVVSDGTLSNLDPPPNTNDPLHDSNNNQPFSTIDKNNGQHGENCALSSNRDYGAWWYGKDDCGYFSLNGKYDPPQWGYGFACLNTASAENNYLINPVQSEMKLRKSVSNDFQWSIR